MATTRKITKRKSIDREIQMLKLISALPIQLRYTFVGVCTTFLVWGLWPTGKSEGMLSVAALAVPIVMHTSGGRLEVATVTATEAFRFQAPPREVLGLNLGDTVSHLEVRVVYRYYIDMAKEWPVRFQGKTAVIEASVIKPSLPVAFDTASMRKQTTSGWARFDKHENLDELELRVSPQLESRAHGYKLLATASARQSVSDFAKTWLSKNQHWQKLGITNIKVVFPEDPAVGPTTLYPAASDL